MSPLRRLLCSQFWALSREALLGEDAGPPGYKTWF